MRPRVPRAVYRPRRRSKSSQSSESSTTSTGTSPSRNQRVKHSFVASNPNAAMAALMIPETNRVHNKEPPIYDSLVTETSVAQDETARICAGLILDGQLPVLQKQKHITFLSLPLMTELPPSFMGLDASKPWLIYWPLQGLALLDPDSLATNGIKSRIASSIMACWNEKDGGFGGGFGQTAHLAATYAAINALAISEDRSAWRQIDCRKIYRWLMSLKTSDGGFRMHHGGEVDVRAVYCALSAASILNIITPELIEGTAEFISNCQTYEGGLGASRDNEAHAGYTFCGLAALCTLGNPVEFIPKYLDVDSLMSWLVGRQYQPEGGFSGRTDKLVDGCYCWWVGGCWALLEGTILGTQTLWSKPDMQKFILYCCQSPHGGLRDKPGVAPDFYHSCYVLSGLSEVQYRYSYDLTKRTNKLGEWSFKWKCEIESADVVTVDEDNAVGALNPVHVVPWQLAEQMHDFFVVLEFDLYSTLSP